LSDGLVEVPVDASVDLQEDLLFLPVPQENARRLHHRSNVAHSQVLTALQQHFQVVESVATWDTAAGLVQPATP
jgi:hypothetical protein